MTNHICRHCNEPLERAASYRLIEWIHTSGYEHCQRGGSFLGTKAEPIDSGFNKVPLQFKEEPCCDGTGWTGDPKTRCTTHYEALDPIWFSR